MMGQRSRLDRVSPARRPLSLGGAVLGGTVAAAAIIAANQLADRLGLTDLDLLRVLGLTFRDPGQARVKPAGLAWYGLSGGVLVPALYWLGFRRLGRAGSRPGALFGIVHYVASGALLAATAPRHPKQPAGQGRPMGAFLSAYGPLEWSANLAGHLLYGASVGLGAAIRCPLPRPASRSPGRPGCSR